MKGAVSRRPPSPVSLLLPILSVLAAATAFGQQSFSGDPFESRFRQTSSFQIKFQPPQKGGEVRLYTKSPVRFEKDVFWEGSEDVRIEYQDIKIAADKARVDFPTKTATLEGHVVIDQGPTRLAGERAVFHLDSKTGVVETASAVLPPSYHIVADSIEKIGEATYRVHHGLFTACDVPNPDWSFTMSEATITLDDYAQMKNVAFRARDLPLLYTPYMVWPTKAGRVSGLLVPGVGYTERRGAYLGLSHYWVTGQSTDLTTQVDLFSSGTIGIGEELRWAPSSESAGAFLGYFVHDTEATVCVPISSGATGTFCTLPDGSPGVLATETRNRWKIRLDHVSEDLPWGMRAVVSIRDYSDREYLEDYERSFALTTAAEIASRAFLTKNEGVHSWNLRFTRTETFLGATVLQERMPTLEYYRRTSEVGGSPVYLSVQASISNLFINRMSTELRGSYGRLDLHPVFSFPWKSVPWLSVTATAGGRWTGYTDSTTDALQTSFEGSTAVRAYGEAGVSIVGPSFSRIYEASIGPFGKFKHVIEPRVDYQFVSDVNEPGRIPVFDDIDTQLGLNQVTYAIVNRLLARPADAKAGSATEIASLEISQTYAFEAPQVVLGSASSIAAFRNEGPVQAALRVTPGTLFSFDGRLSYDARAGQLVSSTIAANAAWRSNFLSATWFSGRPVVAPGAPSADTDQLRVAGGLDVFGPFRLDAEVNYDVRLGQVLEDRSLLTWKGSCYTLFLELRQLRLPGNRRNDVRFVVNLKDIGTLLDVNGALNPSLF